MFELLHVLNALTWVNTFFVVLCLTVWRLSFPNKQPYPHHSQLEMDRRVYIVACLEANNSFFNRGRQPLNLKACRWASHSYFERDYKMNRGNSKILQTTSKVRIGKQIDNVKFPGYQIQEGSFWWKALQFCSTEFAKIVNMRCRFTLVEISSVLGVRCRCSNLSETEKKKRKEKRQTTIYYCSLTQEKGHHLSFTIIA